MNNIKIKNLTKINISSLGLFLILSSFIMVTPFYVHAQWITGPIVNALLILTLLIVGVREAMILSLVPSLMALSGGLIPVILAPIVPFIMVSNIVFIYLIDKTLFIFKNSNYSYWFSVFLASFVKFIFLYFSVNIISKLLIKQELILKISQMMTWTQFFTAFTGGMIAFMILKLLKRI